MLCHDLSNQKYQFRDLTVLDATNGIGFFMVFSFIFDYDVEINYR